VAGEQFLRVLWKRKASLLSTFVLTLAAVAAVTFALPKVYSSTSFMWVNPNRGAQSDFEATQLSQFLTKTYAELLQTRGVADEVARRLPFPISGEVLQRRVTLNPVSDSQLLQITAEGGTPEEARLVADTYARVFAERAGALVRQGVTQSEVLVAEPAPTPSSPVRPQIALYLIIGAGLAALAGVGVALLRERLDQRLEIEEDTTEVLGLPVLGRIPQVVSSRSRSDTKSQGESAAFREAFSLLLTNLSFASPEETQQVIAVTSAVQGEGKTLTCRNLGRVASERGRTIVEVDADLRRPSLSAWSHTDNGPMRPGLSNYLVGAASTDDIVLEVPESFEHMVASGPIPPNPAALLSLPALSRFTHELRQSFDLVLFDTPPLSVGADASVVASEADGVVLLVDSRSTSRSAVARAIDQLHRVRARVLGIVVNGVAQPSSSYYYAPEGRRLDPQPR
jgi:capsular exopolysaccharide synthesis family protein